MDKDIYLQHNETGDVYKVMEQHFLRISPTKDGEDRRVYELDTNACTMIKYQNACMIVNKQFREEDENWVYNDTEFVAKHIDENTDINMHKAMLSMLPDHLIPNKQYIKQNEELLDELGGGSVTLTDADNTQFKMIRHKGKTYYMLIIDKYLPKVQLYTTFGKFCQQVNIKNCKPIYSITDKKYI